MYYLKSESRAALFKSLSLAGMMTDDDTPCIAGRDYALDIIGEILKLTGRILKDNEGAEYAERIPVAGYFANLMMLRDVEVPDSLRPLLIPAPSTPARTFGTMQASSTLLEPIPGKIELWQARAILDMTGNLDKANAAVKSSKNAALKAVWEYGNEISRASSAIDELGEAIGLTPEQIDDLFRNAAALSV